MPGHGDPMSGHRDSTFIILQFDLCRNRWKNCRVMMTQYRVTLTRQFFHQVTPTRSFSAEIKLKENDYRVIVIRHRVTPTLGKKASGHNDPISDDEDIALLIRRENVDPLVCISVEEICHETPEMKHKQPESSHNLHHVTPHHEFHYTHKSNIQRLVPPPCTFYSINSGEIAPRPITIRLEVGELFPSKKQLKSQLGNYALANRFQIRVFKSDTTRYQTRLNKSDTFPVTIPNNSREKTITLLNLE
ncbi:hypothetical protein Ddye_030070 [Dipteronia dyeriana]|uniref:Transposase MuDR plant domain-containing protein n=1 Tax=Dipteronia dyeriana TaxID=168575 RepID=A0AAD9TGB0_9ROSI|nr:hypothetical protein Ddye_030070 [Dipteronia dyeriana]